MEFFSSNFPLGGGRLLLFGRLVHGVFASGHSGGFYPGRLGGRVFPHGRFEHGADPSNIVKQIRFPWEKKPLTNPLKRQCHVLLTSAFVLFFKKNIYKNVVMNVPGVLDQSHTE